MSPLLSLRRCFAVTLLLVVQYHTATVCGFSSTSFSLSSSSSKIASRVVRNVHGRPCSTVGGRESLVSRRPHPVPSTRLGTVVAFASEASGEDPSSSLSSSFVDRILNAVTSSFPLWVSSAAVLGAACPRSLMWVNASPRMIPSMLSLVMLGTGMTLEKEDFSKVLSEQPAAVPAGVLCQFVIMPLTAWALGRWAFGSRSPALFLGTLLVGCSPGGTASNLVSLIAGADVALSVLLTTCSTVLASAVTPALVRTLAGDAVHVDPLTLCAATARVVLAPVAAGVALAERAPRLCAKVSRVAPAASALLVALICGGVVAENAASMKTTAPPFLVLGVVAALHTIGFAAGHAVPRRLLGFDERTARTVSIETGMQNSALAVVLARSARPNEPLASLPGALSATLHSCLGSALAARWRRSDARKSNERERQDDSSR